MITLLVTCVINNLKKYNLLSINETFSNLKLLVFIITGFISRNKEVKQVVLIIIAQSPPLYKEDVELEFCLLYQKIGGGGNFSPKTERLLKW